MQYKSQITTHILDTSRGKPASGITAKLYHFQHHVWEEIAADVTNLDGRIVDLLPEGIRLENGIYKMHFDTEKYFDHFNIPTFYPYIEIVFNLDSDEHFHIPLLLSPFGYTTYRGS